MKKILFLLLLPALAACHHPDWEIVDFEDYETFHVKSVQLGNLFLDNGALNPDIQLMEEPSLDEEPATKVAVTDAVSLVRDMVGVVNSNAVYHISGTYTGHDVDGKTLLTLSGKLVLPKDGPVKNLIIVSHYTIGANYESPSETFPLESIFAAKGYAVAIADYIGYGVTSHLIHPYMHTKSTAQSVVDMALAVKPYLEHIGRSPESEEVILVGYSQGGSTTLAVMDLIQEEYKKVLPIKKVFAGAGPYDLAATFDISMEWDKTGIPCAIPMIVQGVNYGEKLGLRMEDFFEGALLDNYQEWINSKAYTVKEINRLINANSLHEIMTENGRDKTNPITAMLYQSLMANSVLNFSPNSPIYFFHSMDDKTVPFINSLKAEQQFKGMNAKFDFDHYGTHGTGCIRFILTVYNNL